RLPFDRLDDTYDAPQIVDAPPVRERLDSIQEVDPSDADVDVVDSLPPVPVFRFRRADESAPRKELPKADGMFEAVEEGYRREGHWSDLVALYMQRIETAFAIAEKAELLRKIGAVMRDHQGEKMQALDAFIE